MSSHLVWAVPASASGLLRSEHSKLVEFDGRSFEVFDNTAEGRADFYRVCCALGPRAKASAERALGPFLGEVRVGSLH